MTSTQHDARLEVRRTINATRESLFRAWTTPELMRQWYSAGDAKTPVAESDLRVGGRYAIHMRLPDGKTLKVGGEYLEVVANSKLVFTWKWDHEDETSRVTVLFNAAGKNTEVVLIHDRLSSTASRDGHQNGWVSCLEKLGAFATGTPPSAPSP